MKKRSKSGDLGPEAAIARVEVARIRSETATERPADVVVDALKPSDSAAGSMSHSTPNPPPSALGSERRATEDEDKGGKARSFARSITKKLKSAKEKSEDEKNSPVKTEESAPFLAVSPSPPPPLPPHPVLETLETARDEQRRARALSTPEPNTTAFAKDNSSSITWTTSPLGEQVIASCSFDILKGFFFDSTQPEPWRQVLTLFHDHFASLAEIGEWLLAKMDSQPDQSDPLASPSFSSRLTHPQHRHPSHRLGAGESLRFLLFL